MDCGVWGCRQRCANGEGRVTFPSFNYTGAVRRRYKTDAALSQDSWS